VTPKKWTRNKKLVHFFNLQNNNHIHNTIMSKTAFTLMQQEILRNHPSVRSCTSNHVRFTGDFKLSALKLDKEGYDAKYIFELSNIPDFIYESEIPHNAIIRWRKILKTQGKRALYEENRGRKTKIHFESLTDKDKISYLKAENAYLRNGGNFLV
jgi:hypothetical protein